MLGFWQAYQNKMSGDSNRGLHSHFVFIKSLKTMKQTFKDLNIKEKLAILSACAAFCLGWVLTAIAAFVPLLLSEQAILWILGQAMTYSAAVFGVAAYFNAESRAMKRDLRHYFGEQERLHEERMRIREGNDTGELPDKEDEE